MIDINELRRLAQAAISKMNALDPEFVSSVTPLAALELLDRLEAAESSVAWHQRRWMALQMHQKKMREPERTIVCDILANGELMHPTVAGNRYSVMEKSK